MSSATPTPSAPSGSVRATAAPAPEILDPPTSELDLPAARRLFELWAEIRDLEAAVELHDWDEETQLPAQGHGARGQVSATLSGLRHRMLVAGELREALDACAEAASPDGELAAQVRVARHEVERAVRVPERLVRELAAARSAATQAWKRAREEEDFRRLAPRLEHLVELKRQQARAILPEGPAYDALIQEFEPEARSEELEPLFRRLRSELAPLVQAVADSGVTVDESPARGRFPVRGQEAFGRSMATALGFDFHRGRLDLSTHPFCLGLHPTDVRITWRYQEDDFRPAFFGILHEAGHGLYEQGLPAAWSRTPLGKAASLGIHESQSRLWENHVGRNRGFWRWALPRFRETFREDHPDVDRVELDALWRAFHTIQPSFIRVEADQATYNLHVVVRFELERALFSGDLEVAELPAAWNDLYRELLGIEPPDDTRGVLQDIHWPQALFGYFPTYTLGSMAAAQLFAAAERDLGDLEEAFAEGRLQPLLDWMRAKVHTRASRWPADQLVERATGEALTPDALLRHLETHAHAVYGI